LRGGERGIHVPNFSFNWNTITFSEANGMVDATINLEGTAEGFGVVLATLVAHGAGTPSGTFDFSGCPSPRPGSR